MYDWTVAGMLDAWAPEFRFIRLQCQCREGLT